MPGRRRFWIQDSGFRGVVVKNKEWAKILIAWSGERIANSISYDPLPYLPLLRANKECHCEERSDEAISEW